MNLIGPVQKPLCKFCEHEESKYVCPRCGEPYCSLSCYQDAKHGQCSESFYRDCVMDAIKHQEEVKSGQTIKDMKTILDRVHKEEHPEDVDMAEDDDDVLDSDDDEPLELRLKGVSLDDSEAVWSRLTEGEQEDFTRFASQDPASTFDSGAFGIPEWVPWWNMPCKRKMIEEIDSNDVPAQSSASSSLGHVKCHDEQPSIVTKIDPMSQLTKIRPNTFVKNNLWNVIGAYTWTCRLWAGDMHSGFMNDVAGSIITLSSFLGKDTVFQSDDKALMDVYTNAYQNPEYFAGVSSMKTTLRSDVFRILSGPHYLEMTSHPNYNPKCYVLSLLSDCLSIFSAVCAKSDGNKITLQAKSAGSSAAKPEVLNAPSTASTSFKNSFCTLFPDDPPLFEIKQAVLKKAKRKVLYLLSFANENNVF